MTLTEILNRHGLFFPEEGYRLDESSNGYRVVNLANGYPVFGVQKVLSGKTRELTYKETYYHENYDKPRKHAAVYENTTEGSDMRDLMDSL